VAIVRHTPVDIVFMDYNLPGLDGISTSLRLLRVNKSLKIIILTGMEHRPVSHAVLQAGIRGYMTKSSAIEEVSQAIDSVLGGGTYLSRDIVRQAAMASLQAKRSQAYCSG